MRTLRFTARLGPLSYTTSSSTSDPPKDEATLSQITILQILSAKSKSMNYPPPETADIEDYYGVDTSEADLITYRSRSAKGFEVTPSFRHFVR